MTSDSLLLLDEAGDVERASRAASALFRRDALIGVAWQELLLLDGELPNGELAIDVREAAPRCTVRCRISPVEVDGRTLRLVVCHDLAAEDVRRQIGQELHDGLGQLLTGTAFLAKALESNVTPGYEDQARRIVELINQSVARVRSLAQGLGGPPRRH